MVHVQSALAQLQKYRLVVEHTSNMVVITDASKRIEYVNPAYTEVTGWTMSGGSSRAPCFRGPTPIRRPCCRSRTHWLRGGPSRTSNCSTTSAGASPIGSR